MRVCVCVLNGLYGLHENVTVSKKVHHTSALNLNKSSNYSISYKRKPGFLNQSHNKQTVAYWRLCSTLRKRKQHTSQLKRADINVGVQQPSQQP